MDFALSFTNLTPDHDVTLNNIRGHFNDMPSDSLSFKIKEYIDGTVLPIISPEAVSSMVDVFTVEEMAQAIEDFLFGKSLGPDGFKNKFYKLLGEQLVPFMSKVLNSVSYAYRFACSP